MMIRSAPPASAHLADRPVPAPAPTRRSPRATVVRESGFPIRFFRVHMFSCVKENVCKRALGISRGAAEFQEDLSRAVGKALGH